MTPINDHRERMEVVGYVPVGSGGFAMPAYQRVEVRGNAWFHAIPAIEGDHVSPIASFETFDEPTPVSFEPCVTVLPGDDWVDVFHWNGRQFAGAPRAIFEALSDCHVELCEKAPLTFLDLGLAATAPDTPKFSAAARAFLRRRLGDEAGERGFCESVVRPGVALEIRRCFYRHFEALPFGAPVGFETLAVNGDLFHIVLEGEVFSQIGHSSAFDDLRDAIARFGEAIDVGIKVLEQPGPTAVSARPYQHPPPSAEPEILQRGGGRRPRSRLLGFAREFAIDLGTNNTRIYGRGRGILLSEPSMIAINTTNGVRKILAAGDEAKLMLHRTPPNVEVIQPLRDGAISDLDAAVAMLDEFMGQVRPRARWRRPMDVIICIPAASTSLERRVLKQAAVKAGASKVSLVEAPLAAALGAGLPIDEPVGSMLIQVGGGTTEIAVLALRGIAYSTSVRVGGDKMDEAIVNFVRRQYNLLIGARTAEHLKRSAGNVLAPVDGLGPITTVRGRDLINGVPKEIEISQADMAHALAEPVATIIEAIRIALEHTAPELSGDIADTGIVLAGGASRLSGLDIAVRDETGLPVSIAEDPENCVTRGLAMILEDSEWRNTLQ